MNEQLTEFTTAKLAKEKGFDEATIDWWEKRRDKWVEEYPPGYDFGYSNYNKDDDKISRPTQSLLQRWIREKHNIFLTITIPYEEYGRYSAEVWGNNLDDGIKILMIDGMTVFKTYEEALDEGLIEGLKLIEL
jgi:hypothetical protein